MRTKNNSKTKSITTSPASRHNNSSTGGASERIERRDYGTVLIKTPRHGVQIEQLITERPEKKKNSR